MTGGRLRAILEFARRLAGSLSRARSDADLEDELRLHLDLAAAAEQARGLMFGRSVEALLFQMEPTDPVALVVPILALAGAAGIAILAPAIRAVRIDPAQTLRSEG